MADMTIQEFCDRHFACDAVREWAMAHCQSMRDVWDKAKPEWLIWVATRPGVLTDRELRLFAVRCARSVEAAAWAAAEVWGSDEAAAEAAAWAAAEVAREQQAAWLRELKPCFEVKEVTNGT